jgi:hypothetical protein
MLVRFVLNTFALALRVGRFLIVVIIPFLLSNFIIITTILWMRRIELYKIDKFPGRQVAGKRKRKHPVLLYYKICIGMR